MAANQGLRELLIRELRTLYDADNQLLQAFPKFERAASAESLANLCREGVDYTRERIARLERIFDLLDTPAERKRSFGMEGLITDAMEIVDEVMAAASKDAALLAGIQKTTHYGIAAYGAAYGYARTLQEREIADILDESLEEKRDADVEMNGMAENEINPRAMANEEEDEMAGKKGSGRRSSRASADSNEEGEMDRPRSSRSGSRAGSRQQSAQESRQESSTGSRRGRPRKSDEGSGSQGSRSQMRGSQGRRSQAQGSEGPQSRGSQQRGSQSRGRQASGSQGRSSQAGSGRGSGRSGQAQASGTGRAAAQRGGARKTASKAVSKAGGRSKTSSSRSTSKQRSASTRTQSTRSTARKSASGKTSSRSTNGRKKKSQNGRRKAR